MVTTFRQDLMTEMVDSLDVFIAANPTMLRRSEYVRPPSVVGDLPLAFVDRSAERIHWDNQTMDRVITVSVVVVWPLAVNAETVRLVDVLVDALVDHYNVNSIHFVPNSSWTDAEIGDEDYPITSDDGTTRHFYAMRFTFVVSLMEGRA